MYLHMKRYKAECIKVQWYGDHLVEWKKETVLKQSVFCPELTQWEYNMVRYQVGSLTTNINTMPPSTSHHCIKHYQQNHTQDMTVHKTGNTYWSHPISHLQFSILFSSTTFCDSRNVNCLKWLKKITVIMSSCASWYNENKKIMM